MTNWQEIRVRVAREAEEAVSNLLVELGSQGVMIEDSRDYLDKEDLFGEIIPEVAQDDRVTITGYYPDTQDLAAIKTSIQKGLAEMVAAGLELGETSLTSSELAEEDWADNWKKYYEPTRITHDLIIVLTMRSAWFIWQPLVRCVRAGDKKVPNRSF